MDWGAFGLGGFLVGGLFIWGAFGSGLLGGELLGGELLEGNLCPPISMLNCQKRDTLLISAHPRVEFDRAHSHSGTLY